MRLDLTDLTRANLYIIQIACPLVLDEQWFGRQI